MLLKRLLIALLLGCAGATATAAQTVAVAQISGIVRDDSGGVLPGVEVTVMQVETGAVRTVFTNEHGAYVLPNLPEGAAHRLELLRERLALVTRNELGACTLADLLAPPGSPDDPDAAANAGFECAVKQE